MEPKDKDDLLRAFEDVEKFLGYSKADRPKYMYVAQATAERLTGMPWEPGEYKTKAGGWGRVVGPDEA